MTPNSGKWTVLAIGSLFPLTSASFLAINNVAQSLYYEAGGTVPLMLLMRNVGYICCCLLLFPLTGRSFAMRGLNFRFGLASGVLFAIGMTCLLASFLFVSISLAVLTLYIFPILTSFMDAAVRGRWPKGTQLICLFAAFVGLAIALEVTSFEHNPIGIVLAACTAVFFSASFVLNGHKLAGVDSAITTFHMSLSALVVTLLIVAYTGLGSIPALGGMAFAPMWTALAAYLVAFFTMYKGVEVLGPTPTAMVLNLEPVFTMLLAVVVLMEELTLPRVIGAGVVLAAVASSQWLSAHPAEDITTV